MKRKTLKDFDQFLVEASLKGSKGLPSDFLSSADEQALKNLKVKPDSGKGAEQLGSLIGSSLSIINSGSREEVEARKRNLEELAKQVIIEEFGFVLEASSKPVELDIRLVGDVMGNMPGLAIKAEVSEEKPEYEEEEENQESDYEQGPQGEGEESQGEESQEESQEEDDFFSFFDDETQEEQEESEEEDVEMLSNKDVALAIDKKKLLNTLTQGAGKATKDIIKLSDTVREGIERIFGKASAKSVMDIWSRLSDEADKSDWAIPVGMKQAFFKNMPGGIAGAVDVAWESATGDMHNLALLTEDNSDFEKIVIRAYAIDFPMLIHEATKGVYMLLQSAAIKLDPELAREIKRATSSYRDEAEEFRYGPLANMMFATFVNNCSGAARFPNAKERIFGALALDKARGGQFTDEEFLKIVKEIFSSFDKVDENGKIRFVLNREKFESSDAKSKIDAILEDFNRMWEDYEEQLRAWEMDQRFGGQEGQDEQPGRGQEEEESDIDKLVKQTLYGGGEEEKPTAAKDYADMTQAEIQQAISDAVEDEDYELAARLRDNYLKKESRHIWDKEINMLLEKKRFRLRRP